MGSNVDTLELLREGGCASARLIRLVEVFERMVGAVLLRGVGEDDAKECFAKVLAASGRFREHHLSLVFQRLFMEQVVRNVKLEFVDICKELNIAEELGKMEQAIERHKLKTGIKGGSDGDVEMKDPPEEFMTSVICAAKRGRVEELQKKLEEMKATKKELQTVREGKLNQEEEMRKRLHQAFAPIEEAKAAICT